MLSDAKEQRLRKSHIMSALCDLIEDSCLIIWTSANISGEWLPSKGKWEWGEFRSDRPPWKTLLAMRSAAGVGSSSIPRVLECCVTETGLRCVHGASWREGGQQMGSVLILLLLGGAITIGSSPRLHGSQSGRGCLLPRGRGSKSQAMHPPPVLLPKTKSVAPGLVGVCRLVSVG